MPPEIADLIEYLYYRNENLTFFITLPGKFTDVIRRIENFNKTNFERKGTCIFLDNQK